MSFGLFVFVPPQASRVETNTNQANLPNVDKRSSKRAVGSKFVSFEIFVFVTTQASVEMNTNQSESTEYKLSSS